MNSALILHLVYETKIVYLFIEIGIRVFFLQGYKISYKTGFFFSTSLIMLNMYSRWQGLSGFVAILTSIYLFFLRYVKKSRESKTFIFDPIFVPSQLKILIKIVIEIYHQTGKLTNDYLINNV